MLMHPAWGLGFFILVNRAVQWERLWLAKRESPSVATALETRTIPPIIGAAATVGVFSYSLYLTHELVIMQSWWFVIEGFPPILNSLLIVIPATVAFAWLFFRFCEKPYMRKAVRKAERIHEIEAKDYRPQETTSVFGQTLPAIADEA